MSTAINDLVSDVRSRLATEHIGQRIIGFDEVDSTNVCAREALMAGAPVGSVFVADFQTSGRGRLGRRWQSERGVNLMFSVVLRPPAELVSVTGILASLALRSAVEPYTSPLPLAIKWPNDLMLDGLKCSGMLMENVSGGLVLGIGLNVNQVVFPDDYATGATSLLLSTGRHVPRAELLVSLLSHLEARLLDIDQTGVSRSLEEYEMYMHRIGKRVSLHVAGSGRRINGTIVGIRADGALKLDTESGEQYFYAGDVTSQPASENA